MAPSDPRQTRGLALGVMAAPLGGAAAVEVAVLALAGVHQPVPANPESRVVIPRGVDVQQSYDAAGNPTAIANANVAGATTSPRWSACAPADPTGCRPIRSSGTSDTSAFLNQGRTPPGTVFQATLTVHGRTYVTRTGAWLGTVRAVLPPTLTGSPRFGAVMVPHGARWAGGWAAPPTPDLFAGTRGLANEDALSLEACRTPRGHRCVNLTPQGVHGLYSTRPVAIDNWFTGWYLFAFDQRLATPILLAEPGYGTPSVMPTVKVGATAARSAPLGPVTGPLPPTVAILRTATVHDGRILVARVRCRTSCRARVTADDAHTGAGATTALTGTRVVGVPRRQLRSGHRLSVTVQVGAGPLISGRSRLP